MSPVPPLASRADFSRSTGATEPRNVSGVLRDRRRQSAVGLQVDGDQLFGDAVVIATGTWSMLAAGWDLGRGFGLTACSRRTIRSPARPSSWAKAAEAFAETTTAPNQLWQTHFTYLKVIGSPGSYLSTILDDFSRFIVAWKLCTTMRAGDVTDTLELAPLRLGLRYREGSPPAAAAQRRRRVLRHGRPRPLARGQGHRPHVRGAPNHPQTQGKIERWHQTLKNRVLLENYFLPGQLEDAVAAFVDHYNHRRYHESLGAGSNHHGRAA